MQPMRKTVLVFLLLVPGFFICGPKLWAQTPSQTDSHKNITVRVVDGVTGLPEWFEFPNIWMSSGKDSRNPRLNAWGEIQLDTNEASPREIRFLPNWYADCRYKGDIDTGMSVRYSLDEVLENGVVGKNVCGWFHAKPQPGVMVFYVRHRSLLEMIAL